MAFVIIFIPSSCLVEFAIIRRVFLYRAVQKKEFSVSCVLCRDVEDLFIFLMVVVLVCLLLICIILSDCIVSASTLTVTRQEGDGFIKLLAMHSTHTPCIGIIPPPKQP